jgi:hypothetical protein
MVALDLGDVDDCSVSDARLGTDLYGVDVTSDGSSVPYTITEDKTLQQKDAQNSMIGKKNSNKFGTQNHDEESPTRIS